MKKTTGIQTQIYSVAKRKGLKELNLQYQFVCNEWVNKFCKKQDIKFDGWVGDEIGDIGGDTIDLRKIERVGQVGGDSSWLRYSVYFTGGSEIEIYHERKYADNRPLRQMRRERFVELWRSFNGC